MRAGVNRSQAHWHFLAPRAIPFRYIVPDCGRSTMDAIGYLAASLVLAAFWMRSLRPLRCVAIASNLAFIAYGYIGDLTPVLLLHALLLPVNALRLVELGSPEKVSDPPALTPARGSPSLHAKPNPLRER